MGNTILNKVAENFVVGNFYKRMAPKDRLIGEKDEETIVYKFGIDNGHYYFKRYSLLKNQFPQYYTVNRFIRKDKPDDYTITVYTRYLEEMPIETLDDFKLIKEEEVPIEILNAAARTWEIKISYSLCDTHDLAWSLMDYLTNKQGIKIYKDEIINGRQATKSSTDDILLLLRHFFDNCYDHLYVKKEERGPFGGPSDYQETKEIPECVKKFMDAIVKETIVDSTISRGPSVKSVKFGDEKQIDTMIHNCIYRYNLYHDNAKIEYVTDFTKFTIGEITKFRNLGKKCLKTLLLTLKKEYGIVLDPGNISSDVKRMLTINKYFDISKEDENK